MSVFYILFKIKIVVWFVYVVECENCEVKVECLSFILDE